MKLSLAVLLLSILYSCDGARILVLAPFGTLSHKLVYMPIMEALAEKGHSITVVSSFVPKRKVENIREVFVRSVEVEDVDFFLIRKFQFTAGIIPRLWITGNIVSSVYDNLLNNEEFRQLQRSEQFDLVVVVALFNDFCLSIADLWQVPIVTISPSVGPPWILGNMGVPHQLASNPTVYTEYDNRMSFSQRFVNTMELIVLTIVRNAVVINPLNSKLQKDFPNIRTIQEVEKNISLCIVVSHPALNYPRPLPPTVIEINGLHIQPPKALPSDLQRFADESGEHGFIVFTLGSQIKSATIPAATVRSFVRAFALIPQRVIWKWDANEKPEGLSSNVLTVKWLPQSDLLAHPKARLFITHGGLMGMQEAIFYAVPMLGLPIVNDQLLNMAKMVNEGSGLSLQLERINDDDVESALIKILTDPSFQDNMSRLSALMHDEPMPSREKAVYWIEYVLRHGGSSHMRMSSIDLPFYQHYLLDVMAVMIAMALLVVISSVLVLRRLCTRVSSGSKDKSI